MSSPLFAQVQRAAANTPLLQGLAAGAIRSGTSVLYASLGEVIVERAGMVNLGLEGCMLTGACFGFVVAYITGNPFLGLVAAGMAGGCFNLLLGYLIITRRANQLASGLTLLFLSFGLTALVGWDYVGKKIDGFDLIRIPLLADIPYVGPVLFEGDLMIFAALPTALLVWWALYRTRWGLALRAVGEARDYVRGFNDMAIVIELPTSMLAADPRHPGKFGVWGTTSRARGN